MTAEEIRTRALGKWNDGSEQTQVLIEIAAQLADLNRNLLYMAEGDGARYGLFDLARRMTIG